MPGSTKYLTIREIQDSYGLHGPQGWLPLPRVTIIKIFKFMKWYIKLLRWIWEFPQCLLGLILTKLYNVEYKETYKEIPIYVGDFPGGISLGLYILMGESSWKYNRSFIKDHEWGHTRQSIRWGWLYLPGPGLCSICWVGLRRISEKLRRKSYYSVWPENQADKFGGVPKR